MGVHGLRLARAGRARARASSRYERALAGTVAGWVLVVVGVWLQFGAGWALIVGGVSCVAYFLTLYDVDATPAQPLAAVRDDLPGPIRRAIGSFPPDEEAL